MSTDLSALLQSEINAQGPMRFDRFMDLALYHPAKGYYRRSSSRPRIGRTGDYYTSVSVGPLFGRLLARQFLQMWELLERPSEFSIVEQGGEDGQLAGDLLAWCREEAPEFFAQLRYHFVEESEAQRDAQSATLCKLGLMEKAAWHITAALGPASGVGVFFANELVDAFPVRRIVYRAGRWNEFYVATEDGELIWVEQVVEENFLLNLVRQAAVPEVEGYVTEINARAGDWAREIAQNFERGYFLSIDYGFPARIYYAPERGQGTLTAYARHQRSNDVLSNPGEQDITAHVDFTALARAGTEAGLRTIGFLNQQRFLTGIAASELAGNKIFRTGVEHDTRAWHALTNPGLLGSQFQVLMQAKNAPAELVGLRFARPGDLLSLEAGR